MSASLESSMFLLPQRSIQQLDHVGMQDYPIKAFFPLPEHFASAATMSQQCSDLPAVFFYSESQAVHSLYGSFAWVEKSKAAHVQLMSCSQVVHPGACFLSGCKGILLIAPLG